MARVERERWTEEQGRAAIGGMARSGLCTTAFARREGVSRARLVYWKKRLRAGFMAPPVFVAVPLPAARDGQLEIAYGEIVLRVREDLDVEHLTRIVHALRGPYRAC